MVCELAAKSATTIPSSRRPTVTTYDSGHEFSLEHWLEVQQLVEAEWLAEPVRALAKAS